MIRGYETSDLSGAAEVFKETFTAPPWKEKWNTENAEQRVFELMDAPQSMGYVCEEEGRIVAIVLGRKLTYLRGPEYVIDEFCVLPEFQNQGIGTEMLEYIRADLIHHGIIAMVLLTTKGYPSEKFYLKNGFEQSEDMIFMYNVFDKL